MWQSRLFVSFFWNINEGAFADHSVCFIATAAPANLDPIPEYSSDDANLASELNIWSEYLTLHAVDYMNESVTNFPHLEMRCPKLDVSDEFTLGIPGYTSAFSHCSNKVTIAEVSGGTGEITILEQFIQEHVNP
ncbi:hypothetical protein DCAR_0209433 [Daucus carota subsp. sativus]|uniref:Uncharacterized protein n=1 Tax=Daucus carota subsp. sativus TaxID=79200 RepID=A0A166F9H5_DAUCS|nr:hypothetical protein DCAR_0209433 [Daucus carota subsp. sativus]